jgi:chemotaxis protein MotA
MQKPLSKKHIALMAGGVCILAGASFFGLTGSFLSVEGLVIVIGGSVANAFLSFERDDVKKAFDTIRTMLKKTVVGPTSLHKDIMRFIQWAYIVQAHDFMELEKEGATVKEPFLRYGLDMVVTAYPSEKIREMLHTVADAEFERRCIPVTVLRNMAATAPAFGMVGTLIGMVIILKNVGMDINGIGGGLAIAMLSTLYGILIARLVCLPAADKLLRQEEKERFRNYMLTEGMAILAEKQSPFYTQDKLNSFLQPSQHFSLDNLEMLSQHRRFRVAA